MKHSEKFVLRLQEIIDHSQTLIDEARAEKSSIQAQLASQSKQLKVAQKALESISEPFPGKPHEGDNWPNLWRTLGELAGEALNDMDALAKRRLSQNERTKEMRNFEIIRAENGYLVRPIVHDDNRSGYTLMYVFSTEDQLADWIRTRLAEVVKS